VSIVCASKECADIYRIPQHESFRNTTLTIRGWTQPHVRSRAPESPLLRPREVLLICSRLGCCRHIRLSLFELRRGGGVANSSGVSSALCALVSTRDLGPGLQAPSHFSTGSCVWSHLRIRFIVSCEALHVRSSRDPVIPIHPVGHLVKRCSSCAAPGW
jgi:hypothetical protein